MNFKEIKELIEILDQSSLTEINIEDNKGSVVNLKTERDRNNHTTIYTTSTISTEHQRWQHKSKCNRITCSTK